MILIKCLVETTDSVSDVVFLMCPLNWYLKVVFDVNHLASNPPLILAPCVWSQHKGGLLLGGYRSRGIGIGLKRSTLAPSLNSTIFINLLISQVLI